MLILSFKPGHDGTIAAIQDGRLLFSLEAEKDSNPRYNKITPELLVEAGALLERVPDVIAVSGWFKGVRDDAQVDDGGIWGTSGGYFSISDDNIEVSTSQFFGKTVSLFSSSHARSHIWSAFAMSSLPAGTAAYCLVWEGALGDFYEILASGEILHIGRPLSYPGLRYQLLYGLADPAYQPTPNQPGRFGDAGKMMALAAYSDRTAVNREERALIDHMLSENGYWHLLDKRAMGWSPFVNGGIESVTFKNLAGKFSDSIFARFHVFAQKNLTKRLPLIIAGGCGLNCDWNSMWEESGLFESVFVPPCANDTGSAIGTAVDAQRHFTGNTKIIWNVYCGQEFIEDEVNSSRFQVHPKDLDRIADLLYHGEIVAWAAGRCEAGPRALGHRSILASPLRKEMTQRLNRIKQRESFRPIAPVCLEEDVATWFSRETPSPFMLHFSKVRSRELPAITHVDNSARVQTVSQEQNPNIHALLCAFKEKSGFGVLCNTSLNFNGRGFINRTSDLMDYCSQTGINYFVVNDKLYGKT
jgi:predicted NodU family carbamoyl transferase